MVGDKETLRREPDNHLAAPAQLLDGEVDDACEELFLVLEVEIEGSLGDLRFVSDLLHRRAGESLAGQDAGRRLFAALGANRVNGLLIDQDIRDIPGVFVPFFRRPAWTPSGAASLALRHGCPVVPMFAHRRSDGRHLAEIHPPLPDPPPGPSEERITALTAAATAAIERQIRAYPEQWVWMHRRWRTQPTAAAEAAGPAESSGAAG